MLRSLGGFITVSLIISVAIGSVFMYARAYDSQVQQDIFTADCTATTTNTGSGVTTAYGCPEPPTIESYLRIMAGDRILFEGWYDVLNMKSLRIKFTGAHTYEYIYHKDAELTLVGDRWELRLDELPVGVYTMTVYMLATNGETVATSQQVIVHGSGEVQGDGAGVAAGVSSSSSGNGSGQRRVDIARQDVNGAGSNSQSQNDETRTVTDARTPILEYLRQVITSYVSPSLLVAFIVSLLVCGYVFYILGRHYRRMDQQHHHKADALRRASHTLHNRPRRRLAAHHIVHRQRRRHI